MSSRLTWKKADHTEQQLRDYLLVALLRSRVCVLLQNKNFQYEFIANLPECWSVPDDAEPTDASLFGPEISLKLADLKEKALETSDKASMEIVRGSESAFEFHVEAIATKDGSSDILTTIVDISEERRREKILRALLRELSHRSKNLLAIIQSVAAQTARHSGSFDQFLEKFRGRLFSLSGSQDLVTDSNWQGARFLDLVRHQIDRYVPEYKHLISTKGENLLLWPNAALHIGLALHELIVNAASHGLLSSNAASISIACRKTKLDGEDAIEIEWLEQTRNPRESDELFPEPDRHFGGAVLEKIVPASVNGVAAYTFDNRHVIYRLVFPAKH